MSDRAGGMDERDVDERFASIISRWDSPLPTAQDPQDLPPEQDVRDGAAPAVGIAQTDESDSPGETVDGAGSQAGAGAGASPPVEDDPGPVAGPSEESRHAGPREEPPPVRPPWINPSPIEFSQPAAAWRAAEPTPAPADDRDQSPGGSDAEEEHFEPPAVRLPPQEDLHFWGAVIGLVAGPLMLVYVAMARPHHSTRWFLASVVVSLAGFALLVLRQPTHRDPTSGDDGARI